MAISATITQETGVNATYHLFNGNLTLTPTSLTVQVSSYLDQPSFAAGKAPLSVTGYDATPVLATPAAAPANPASIAQVISGLIEPYLISVVGGPFNGGAQVA